MIPPILFEQTTFLHVDTGLLRHQVVGVLDPAIVAPRAQIKVLANAIELQEPLFEALCSIELPAADCICPRIPGDDRLRARRQPRCPRE